MQFSLLAVLIHGNHSVENLLGELGEALSARCNCYMNLFCVWKQLGSVLISQEAIRMLLSLMIAKKYAEYQLAVIFKHQCQRTEKCYHFANMKTRKHFQCSNHSLIKQEKWLITDRKLMTICMILHKSTICQRNLTPVLTEVTIFWLKATAEV